MESSFNDISGKSLWRLSHFLEWYCGCDIAMEVRGGFPQEITCTRFPTAYNGHIDIPLEPDRVKEAFSIVIRDKAHGFLTHEGKLFATFTWDGETDIPTFTFHGHQAVLFGERQAELKERAIADHDTENERFPQDD